MYVCMCVVVYSHISEICMSESVNVFAHTWGLCEECTCVQMHACTCMFVNLCLQVHGRA